jgi:hypothetical protein
MRPIALPGKENTLNNAQCDADDPALEPSSMHVQWKYRQIQQPFPQWHGWQLAVRLDEFLKPARGFI